MGCDSTDRPSPSRRARALVFVLTSCAVLAAVGCTGSNSDFCDNDTPCPSGQRCNLATRTCRPTDASTNDTHDGQPAPDVGSDAAGDTAGDAAVGLGLGETCQSGTQCSSTYCIDGVCCESLCEGKCRACNNNADLGKCMLAKGTDPRGDCSGTATACAGSCDGTGGCSFPDATKSCGADACTAGERTTKSCDSAGGCTTAKTSCGGFACAATGGTCKASCAGVADCHGTAQCVTKTCVAQLPFGTACGSNDLACASKLCTDGVCCSVRTCPVCKRCGAGGACVNGPNKVSCGAISCSGSTLSTPECSAGACSPVTSSCGRYQCKVDSSGCRTSCTGTIDSQCTTGNFCDGTSCVAQLGLGAKCSRKSQCASGRDCVDGVCCSVSDCGACKACALGSGACQNLPDGPAPTNDCPGDPACNPNMCKGGSCDYSVGQTCLQQCSGETYTRSRCSASGTCTAQAPTSCTPYVCAANNQTCRSSCVGDGECVSASVCDRVNAHTSGAGVCVDTTKIQDVAGGSGLQSAVIAAITGGKTHVRMTGSVYTGGVSFLTVGKVTLVGLSAGGAAVIESSVASGSTIQIGHPGADIAFQNVTIQKGGLGNSSALNGPPAAKGDGINCLAGKVTVVDSTITDNESFGIRSDNCAATVRRTYIRDNGFGGIKHTVDARLVVTSSSIVRNRRSDSISFPNLMIGYGIWNQPTGSFTFAPVIENVVIAENGLGASASVTGGGINCNNSGAVIKNCIVYDNDLDIGNVDTVSDNILGCTNVTYTTYSGATTISGAGNLKNTDCLLDAVHRPGAPCQNNGGTTTLFWDIVRGPRVKGAAVDRGAYEVN